jgi:putative sterol carrier protein
VTYESAQQFFDGLKANADRARTSDLSATYRFDIAGVGSWRVEVNAGAVTVEESDGPADCAIATDERTFLAVVQGDKNPVGAYMTGKIRVEGDVGLALRLRDLV